MGEEEPEHTEFSECGRDFYDDGYAEEEEVLNNRIVFSPDKFFGRKRELAALKQVYRQEVCCYESDSSGSSRSSSAQTPVVIVDGFSGTGKSTLIRRFLFELAEESHGDVDSPCPYTSMQGKFEELQNTSPFSAVIEAVDDFCRSLLQEFKTGNDQSLERIRTAIKDSVGDEISTLKAFVPSLGDLLKEDDDDDEDEIIGPPQLVETDSTYYTNPAASTGDSWNRLKYLFGQFFHAICTPKCPLVMFLDDLQWADDASLGLLSSLVDDDSLRHFLFIGAMRSELNKDKSSLSDFLYKVNAPSRKFLRIELLNLSIEDIGDFVSDTLNMSVEETWPLTEVIYGKTRGNIFYSMQTLEELQRRNVLYYSMITFQWEWNLTGVEFDNVLSNNVIEAVSSKIQSMPAKLQRALVIASYTRSTIDVDTLMALMNADNQNVDQQEVVGLLDIAVLEGLLKNTIGSDVYKFGHDRIKEAAYWLVPSGQERDELRITIGKNLVELAARPEGKDWMLFVAADHLNSCRGHGQDDLSLAELNLKCGKKANKLAAFVPASLYLRLALKYLRKLGEDPWESHYDLSLQVYRNITNTELCLGNFDSGNDLGRQLIEKATCLDDRLPTYLSLAVGKGRQRRYSESMMLCQDVLRRLDALPKRFRCVKMMRDFLKVKTLLRNHSDREILKLPICQDKKKAIVMDFLSEYSFRAYLCGNLMEFLYAVVKRIRISFKYGLARGSANAFACFGMFLQGPGKDQEGALRMARLARDLISKKERASSSTNALTLLIVAAFIEPWTYPRERIMDTMQKAHLSGMASGNIEVGFQNWTLCNAFAQTCGYPLEPIAKACNELKQQLRLYHVDSVFEQFEHIQLTVSCLLGDKDVTWNELEPTFLTDEKDKLYSNAYGCLSRLEIGVYFGNYEFAVRMSKLIQPYVKLDGSYLITTKEHYFSALAHCGLARETGNRKHVSQAAKFAKRLRYLNRTRGANVLYRCLLVEAEILTFRCDNASRLITAYDSAIHAASQAGCIHDAALGCELAGSSLIELGEENLGFRYLNQARDLWREYQAHTKVQLLVRVYGRKLDMVGTVTSHSSVKDHYCVSSDFSDSHRKTVDLTLLSGSGMKTDVLASSSARNQDTVISKGVISKDKQEEVSVLSELDLKE
ncbi:MAG: hypothetical protein SGILL_004527 [Bacillariaceae sp.]